MAYHTIWSYLWDLVDDGIDESVRYLGQELGLDAVSVATAYHTFQQLRPQRPGAKLLTADTAALYFQPDPALYRDTRLRPHVAALARQDNPLARLAEACRREGLDLISWTVGLHNSHLAVEYPHCAERTAYGDNPGWALCPGEPEVRSYLVALCRDLASNYQVRRLELESCAFGGYGHAHYHVKDGVNLGAVGRYLFGLSFSPGCLDRARERGIDGEGLQRWVRGRLDGVFASGRPLEGDLEEFVSGHPELQGFQAMREDLVISLVEEIRQASGVEVSFLLMGDRWGAGIDAARMAATADLVEILAYVDTPEKITRRLEDLRGTVPDPSRLVVGLQAYYPCAVDAGGLVAQVEAARREGVEQFSYYNYGIMPRPNLGWLRQCTPGPPEAGGG